MDPNWSDFDIRQYVGQGNAAGRDQANASAKNRQKQRMQSSMALDLGVKDLAKQLSAAATKIADLNHALAQKNIELERAMGAFEGLRAQHIELLDQHVEESMQRQRLKGTFLKATAAAVAVAGLLVVSAFGIGRLTAARPSNPQLAISTSSTQVPATKQDFRGDQNAAIDAVNAYFAAIRAHDWSALQSLQSDRFKAANKPSNVEDFWSNNDQGLWTNPSVVKEDADSLWLRVPFIVGPPQSTTYHYVYWRVLRGSWKIDKGGDHDSSCTAADLTTCRAIPSP